MQYFTEQAASHREALEMVRSKYGETAQVLSHKTVRLGGFLGFFAREGVEVTGYIRPEKSADAEDSTGLLGREAARSTHNLSLVQGAAGAPCPRGSPAPVSCPSRPNAMAWTCPMGTRSLRTCPRARRDSRRASEAPPFSTNTTSGVCWW